MIGGGNFDVSIVKLKIMNMKFQDVMMKVIQEEKILIRVYLIILKVKLKKIDVFKNVDFYKNKKDYFLRNNENRSRKSNKSSPSKSYFQLIFQSK